MQPKLILNFDRLGETDFQSKVGTIIAALTANPSFPEPWPAPAPSLLALNEAYQSYRSAFHACVSGDTFRINQRRMLRHTLTEILRRLSVYLEFVAEGDRMALASTGFDLRRDSNRTSGTEPLPAPKGFKVLHGAFSGTLDIRLDSLPGAASFEIQIAQGDPTQEANWKHAMTTRPRARITLGDLTPRQDYWIRMRGVGVNGNGRWTDPVNMLVI
ncbi:Fibronectin type III domain protein [Leptothrix cholodnii SP-6]|uniref:Fibronectin type III domain protein n=1 Tax=Leptothrix cholodnii (strain ATCC 51168 / LMG 8142 / SP-6) TaxID=395495 RepID=B1Y672_LEPCP|nr:hypothetical protein [Leptothrix cholodnii]ACB33577.1 Fibronectin type III domain protein [Leptothrix cholodnii SP-6]